MKTIKENVLELLKEKNMTITDLAKEMGMEKKKNTLYSFLRRTEKNKYKSLNDNEWINRIAETLKVNPIVITHGKNAYELLEKDLLSQYGADLINDWSDRYTIMIKVKYDDSDIKNYEILNIYVFDKKTELISVLSIEEYKKLFNNVLNSIDTVIEIFLSNK